MSQTAVAKKTTTANATSGGMNKPDSDVLDDKTLTDPLKIKEAEINADGALTWEAALGEKIGGPAWSALKDELTPDKLLGHANGALDTAFDKLLTFLDGKAPEEMDFDKISAELEKVLGPKIDEAASKLIGGENGLALKIKQFAADNPWLLASAAVAGAVGYLLSNPDLPQMKAMKTKLAGHPMVIDAQIKGKLFDLGKISNLTVEKLGAKYSWKGGSASAEYGQEKGDNGTTHKAKAAFDQKIGKDAKISGKGNMATGPDGTKIDASGKASYKGIQASGSYKSDDTGDQFKEQIGGKLGLANKNFGLAGSFLQNNAGDDSFNLLRGDANLKFGDFSANGNYQQKTDLFGNTTDAFGGKLGFKNKTSSLSLSGDKKFDDSQKFSLLGSHKFDGGGLLNGGANYGLNGDKSTFDANLGYKKDNFAAKAFYKNQQGPDQNLQTAGGELSYKSGDFTGAMKGQASNDGSSSFTGSAAYKTGTGFDGKLDLSHMRAADGTSSNSFNVGAEYKKGDFSAFGGVGAEQTNGGKWDPAAKIGLKWSF